MNMVQALSITVDNSLLIIIHNVYDYIYSYVKLFIVTSYTMKFLELGNIHRMNLCMSTFRWLIRHWLQWYFSGSSLSCKYATLLHWGCSEFFRSIAPSGSTEPVLTVGSSVCTAQCAMGIAGNQYGWSCLWHHHAFWPSSYYQEKYQMVKKVTQKLFS